MFFSRKKIHFNSKKEFLYSFWQSPEHNWIKNNRNMALSLEELFESIPLDILNDLTKRTKLILAQSSGRYGCAVESQSVNIIICFPDLIDLLSRYNSKIGQAILAHELGHLYHNHSTKKISPLEAQREADAFAVKLGFGYELSEFLESQVQSIDTRVRLTYITSSLFSNS